MTPYQRYLQSEHWRNLRAAKLAFTGPHCNRCRQFTDHPEVHHVYYRRSWFDCQLCDLEVLCPDCHDKAHGKQLKKFKRVKARNYLAFRHPYKGDGRITARY